MDSCLSASSVVRLCDCTMLNPQDRFWSRVKKTDNCWLWISYCFSNGYGSFTIKKRKYLAHRLSYEWLRGPIPQGMVLDHLCRVRPCVNPAHLEPVSLRENLLRGIGPTAMRAHQTICIHGHAFTPTNTYLDPKRGTRICRACRKAYWQAHKRTEWERK